MPKERTAKEMAKHLHSELVVEALLAGHKAIHDTLERYDAISPADVVCIAALLSDDLQHHAHEMNEHIAMEADFKRFLATLTGTA